MTGIPRPVSLLALIGVLLANFLQGAAVLAQPTYTYPIIATPIGGTVHDPSINDAGQVALIGGFPVNVWRGDGGPLTSIYMRDGENPPGNGRVSINAGGAVAFRALGAPFFARIAVGDGAAPATIVALATNTVGVIHPSINDHGQVVFEAQRSTGNSVVMGSSFDPIAGPGDAVPGGTVAAAFAPVINNNGQVAFVARTTAGVTSIFRKTIADGTILLLGPASAAADSFGFNNSGAVAFWTTAGGGSIMVSDGVATATVAVRSAGFVPEPHRVSINDSGDVAFLAGDGTGASNRVFVGNGTSLREVLHVGESIPDLGTVLTVSIGNQAINDRGQVAILVTYNNGSGEKFAVVRADPPTNTAPESHDSAFGTAEDTPLSDTLAASDADGGALGYSIVSNGTIGTAVLTDTATGAFTYTPNPNANGSDAFTFMANDGTSDSNVATVTVTITPVNDTPSASGGVSTPLEDTAVSGVLAASDVENDPLSFSIAANGTLGTAVVTNALTGAFTYTPNPNAFGQDSFTYQVSDGGPATSMAIVVVTITPVNDAPIAVGPDAATTLEDTAVAIRPADNDLDIDGPIGMSQISTFTPPAHGTVTQPGTQTLVYTPAANYNGSDSFTYTITDLGGATATGIVQVTVTPANDAPVVSDGAVSTDEDVAIDGSVAGSDIDGDPLTFSLDATGGKGHVSLNASSGAFTYTPHPNMNGADTFTVRASDGDLQSDPAIVHVTIAAVNDGPMAQHAAIAVARRTTFTGQLVATDADGDALTFSLVQQGVLGTATISTAGSFTYLSAAAAGQTDQFTFSVSDGQTASFVASVTVTLLAGSGVPIASDAALSTLEDTPASGTLRAVGQSGLPLSYTIESNGSKGTATITNVNTGAFVYTPNPNVTGADSFTFRATDGSLASNRARVTLSIGPVNDLPAASNGSLAVIEDRPRNGMLIGSDVDGDALTFAVAGAPAKGTVTITNAATGRYTYTPNPNAVGADAFTFQVSDGIATSNVGSIAIAISAANDAPTAQDIAFSTPANTALVGTLPASDPDGDGLTFEVRRSPRRGTITSFDPATGAFTYEPDPGFSGTERFTFRVNDGFRSSGLATVTITVVP